MLKYLLLIPAIILLSAGSIGLANWEDDLTPEYDAYKISCKINNLKQLQQNNSVRDIIFNFTGTKLPQHTSICAKLYITFPSLYDKNAKHIKQKLVNRNTIIFTAITFTITPPTKGKTNLPGWYKLVIFPDLQQQPSLRKQLKPCKKKIGLTVFFRIGQVSKMFDIITTESSIAREYIDKLKPGSRDLLNTLKQYLKDGRNKDQQNMMKYLCDTKSAIVENRELSNARKKNGTFIEYFNRTLLLSATYLKHRDTVFDAIFRNKEIGLNVIDFRIYNVEAECDIAKLTLLNNIFIALEYLNSTGATCHNMAIQQSPVEIDLQINQELEIIYNAMTNTFQEWRKYYSNAWLIKCRSDIDKCICSNQDIAGIKTDLNLFMDNLQNKTLEKAWQNCLDNIKRANSAYSNYLASPNQPADLLTTADQLQLQARNYYNILLAELNGNAR
ncbi:hypothetical protein ACFL54_04515 [Planctomycetota bacterium]